MRVAPECVCCLALQALHVSRGSAAFSWRFCVLVPIVSRFTSTTVDVRGGVCCCGLLLFFFACVEGVVVAVEGTESSVAVPMIDRVIPQAAAKTEFKHLLDHTYRLPHNVLECAHQCVHREECEEVIEIVKAYPFPGRVS